MQVISAIVNSSSFYGTPRVCIDVVIKGESDYVYELIKQENELFVRGEDGDTGDFNALTNNHNGFGGSIKKFKLSNGQTINWAGPWSSRTGVINQLWPNKEPLVECVSQYQVITYVRKDTLEKLGIKLMQTIDRDGEIYYRPV